MSTSQNSHNWEQRNPKLVQRLEAINQRVQELVPMLLQQYAQKIRTVKKLAEMKRNG